MTNSSKSPKNLSLRNWAIGILIAVGSASTLADDNLSNQTEDLVIVLTRESIRVGAAVLCSVAALETTLASEPRTIHIIVKTAPDVGSEILLRVTETLRTLGFDQVSKEGAGYPGWTLYPPPPEIELHGCEQHDPEDAGEP